MPIEIQIWDDAAGVVYHCSGALTAKDFADANDTFLASPEEIKKWRYSIVDLNSMESMNMRYDEVAYIVQRARRIAEYAPPGVLIAVCSPNDLGFGLGRMWEALVEQQIGWETHTFRTRSEAEAWIRQRAQQKFGFTPLVGPPPA